LLIPPSTFYFCNTKFRFPSECQLLVISVLKSEKAHRAYDNAMREMHTPGFVPLAAVVRLFRLDSSVKKGRPTLELLLSDVISMKWPNLAMQQQSKRDITLQASAATPRRASSSDTFTPTPLSPGPPTPASFPATSSVPMSAQSHFFSAFMRSHLFALLTLGHCQKHRRFCVWGASTMRASSTLICFCPSSVLFCAGV
jgi:hypothetical protein